MVGNRAYDTICSMGCPRCILVGGACTRSIWNDNVKVPRLCAKIKSNCWAFKMDSSSDWGRSDATSFTIGGSKVLRNQSRKIMSSSWILHKLQCRRHSWMWSVMWVGVFWKQDNKISTSSSYLTGSWKYYRNMNTGELKSGYLACGSSMYHLAATPMRVCWNSISLIKSSTMFFDEHHK